MTGTELPEWTTEMDREILELLNTELILTPSVIAENIDRSSGAVARRLNSLEAGGLVRKKDRGKYQITPQALDKIEGGFELITTEKDIREELAEEGKAHLLYVRDRDDRLEEEGRLEMDQETYGHAVLGMIEEQFEDLDTSTEWRDPVKAGITNAEKYYKVVEDDDSTGES